MRSTEQSAHVLERVDRVALTRDRLRLEAAYDKDTTDTMTAALVAVGSAVVVVSLVVFVRGTVVLVGVVVRAIVVLVGVVVRAIVVVVGRGVVTEVMDDTCV
jgi:hypothetical protein